jgi:hypothetical protein
LEKDKERHGDPDDDVHSEQHARRARAT